MKCKITEKKMEPFMSFGKMPIANGFLEEKDFNKEFFFNMEIGFSNEISLLQLNDHPKPSMMFNDNYPFFTGSSEYMKSHFKNYADWIKKNYVPKGKNIIEIGSNDGTFLKNFNDSETNAIGFEPSNNVANKAKIDGTNTLNEFFNTDTVSELKNFLNRTDLICAANAICHIPDLNNLIKAIDLMLNKKGLFIFEEPYLGSMFKKTSYDQIYDEHIFIFSVTAINKIFNLFEMQLIDCVPQDTHGGSMRYVISRKNTYPINKNVNKYLEIEKRDNLDNISSCLKFKSECELSKEKLKSKIKEILNQNRNICGYAATSKSTTILNYCDISKENIDYICDTTKEKIGKYSPGTHIPIVSMEHFKKNMPDVAFLFAWNHKTEIFEKEKEFSKLGEWIAHIDI